jgi:hypothetical protein
LAVHQHYFDYFQINRFSFLFNVTTTYSLTRTGLISNFYIFSALPMIPLFFMLKPVQIGESWYGAVTDFALIDTFKIYVICIFFLESVLPIVLLIAFSLLAMVKFNQRNDWGCRTPEKRGCSVFTLDHIHLGDFHHNPDC